MNRQERPINAAVTRSMAGVSSRRNRSYGARFLVTSLLIALVSSGGLLAADSADPLTIEFYEVRGGTQRELRNELDRLGPLDPDGSRHDGYTEWHISWSYQLSPDGGGCEIQSIETELKVTMTLPQWGNTDRAAERLVRRWQEYMSALRLHEDGHYAIALDATEEVKRRVVGLRSVTACATFGEEVNAIAEAVLAEYRQKEREYDSETDHGRTQGAVFP